VADAIQWLLSVGFHCKKEERMSLLNDQDLVANIATLADGVKLPTDPFSKDSPVQAASLDLHIGDIYLPGKEKDEIGGTQNSKLDVELETGATAVVTTRERLHLPADIAGFGFPPSSVSFRGLLMTNPGHVDPGYEGVMRFTVINMAKETYHLRSGDRIVRLLLFRLNKTAHSDWRQRHPEGSHLPTQAEINVLSEDFVDVERRAERIARKHGSKVSALIAGGLTIVTLFLGLVSSGHLFHNADIEDLKKKQEMVDYDLKNRVEIERKLQDFENRLKDLERVKSTVNREQSSGKTVVDVPGKQP
jgi:deoxycytidine triphosphate deaminase